MLFKQIQRLGAVADLAASAVATSAGAGPIQFTTSFITTADAPQPNTFPSDPGGLDGAQMSFVLNFNYGPTLQNGAFLASSASLVVAGATNPASNGVFDISQTIGIATIGRGGLGRPARLPALLGGGPILERFEVACIFSAVRFDANKTVVAAEGDALSIDILKDISFVFAGNSDNAQLTNFNSQQFMPTDIVTTATMAGVAAVPLPAGLPLLLVGLAGLGLLGARRRKALAA